jgi:hypothetical protein
MGADPMFNNLLTTLRVFALFAFAFSPSMLFLVFIAYLTGSTWWFVFLGLPTLIVNGLIILLRPGRTLFESQLRTITGRA